VTSGIKQKTLAIFLIGLGLISLGLLVGGVVSTRAWAEDYKPQVDTRYDLFAAKDAGKQIRFMGTKSNAEVSAAMKKMNEIDPVTGKSLNQLIDEEAGGLAEVMKAIVIHETSGEWKSVLELGGGGAICAYQIDPGTLPDVAKALGYKSTQAAGIAIKGNLRECVKAGKWVLDQKMDGVSQDVALCRYNGQTTMLKANKDKCWASVEYNVIISILKYGYVVVDVNNDKKSDKYNTYTIKSATGEVLAEGLNCQDHTAYNLAKALSAMADYYQVYTSEVRETAHVQGVQSRMDSTIRSEPYVGIPPSVGKTFCVDDIVGKMSIIAALMNAGTMVVVMLSDMLTGLLNQLCTYAVSAMKAAVDTLMNSICLPMPDLSYSMSLPSMKRKSCDGISMMGGLVVNSGTLTAEQVKAGVDSLISGVPGIDSLPTITWSSPSLSAPLRAIFGSKPPP